MTKTLLALCGAVLLSAPVVHAQGARGHATLAHPGFANHVGSPAAARPSVGGPSTAARQYAGGAYRGTYRHGGYHGGTHHHGNRGRYYYFGGIPYFYPFYGYGYPYYGGFYGDVGFNGAFAGANNGNYEGRVADDDQRDEDAARGTGNSLPTAVQRQLAKRGYYKGTVDGQFGPQTSSALTRFQKKQGLQETGRIDEPTLEALGFTDRH